MYALPDSFAVSIEAVFARIIMLPFLILLQQMLPLSLASPAFIPGEGCGVTNAVRTLKEFPKHFDGEMAGMGCTIVLDGPSWRAYQSSLEEEDESQLPTTENGQ